MRYGVNENTNGGVHSLGGQQRQRHCHGIGWVPIMADGNGNGKLVCHHGMGLMGSNGGVHTGGCQRQWQSCR